MQSLSAPPAVRQSIWHNRYRCYRISATFAFIAIASLIFLWIDMVGPAIDGLSLKPATCTVLYSEIGESQSCSCGKYCSSSFPCLKIYVSYRPKGHEKNVSKELLHNSVYERNDNSKCSTAPCDMSEELNAMSVDDFQNSYGREGQQYPCYFNTKRPDEVVTTTDDNFKMVILHCILWPLVLFFSMIGLMVGMYLYQKKRTPPNDGQDIHLV